MKIPQLTITRFFAAIFIVFYHDQGNTFPFNQFKNWINFANVFVSYFFVLSGFILVISSAKNINKQISSKHFWHKRFARIYPVYIFALLLYSALALFARHPNETFEYKSFFSSVFLIQSWIPEYSNDYNFVGWSLSVEALFYFIFPFLFTHLKNKKTILLIVVAVSVWLLSLVAFILFSINKYSFKFVHYFPLLHVNTFICGVITGVLFIRHKKLFERNNLFITVSFVVLLVIAYLCIVTDNKYFQLYYHNGLLAPLFILFILSLATAGIRVKAFLSHPSLQFLGEISYGIYILQVPVIIIIHGINSRFFKFSHTFEFYFYVLFLLGFCSLSYLLIEKPSRNYLYKIWYVNSKKKLI